MHHSCCISSQADANSLPAQRRPASPPRSGAPPENRLHSSLGYRSPAAYEATLNQDAAAQAA